MTRNVSGDTGPSRYTQDISIAASKPLGPSIFISQSSFARDPTIRHTPLARPVAQNIFNDHLHFRPDRGISGVTVNTMLLAFELLFGCWHRDLSRPFTLSGWTYEVCLNCGKKLAYDRADIGCIVAAHGRSEVDLADKLWSAMRYQFGGHLEKSGGNSEAA